MIYYEQLLAIDKSNNSEIYNQCYNIYKKEYLNNKDFSIQDEDITEEIDEILNDFDNHMKYHNNSSSVYSEILSNLDISINSNPSESHLQSIVSPKKNTEYIKKNKVVRKFSDNRNKELPGNLKFKPELKTDLDDEQDIKINHGKLQEELKKNVENNFDPDIVIYEEKRPSINIGNTDNSGMDDLDYTKSDIMAASRLFGSKLLTNENLISNPSLFTQNSFISRRSLVQSSNMFFDIENEYDYNKNSVDNNDIKKSDPQFNFSPKTKRDSNMFSNISNINQDQDIGLLKMMSSNVNTLNMINNTNSSNSRRSSSQDNSPSNATIQQSQKFLSISKNDLNNSIIGDENLNVSRGHKLEKFLEKISLKTYIFNLKSNDFNPSDYTRDEFLSELISIIIKNNLNEECLNNLSLTFPNRYEISFMKICTYFREMKTSKRDSKLRNSTTYLIEKIHKEIKYSNDKLKKNDYILETNHVDNYIFKPSLLLRLWDKDIEDVDIETYRDINKYFYLKLMFVSGDLQAIYNEIIVMINYENTFEKSIIFIYYFGKFLRMLIIELETSDQKNLKTKIKQFDFIKNRDETTYNKLFNILKKFINSSQNNRRRANTYLNLVKISQFFRIDDQKIEIFENRAKKLLDSYADQNKAV